VGDWPIKEFLKHHLTNQRAYKRHVRHKRAAAAAQGKGKGKAVREASDSFAESWYDSDVESLSASDKESNDEEKED
jgi:hypothetical protein